MRFESAIPTIMLDGSSAVEPVAVNHAVAGSIPAYPAKIEFHGSKN